MEWINFFQRIVQEALEFMSLSLSLSRSVKKIVNVFQLHYEQSDVAQAVNAQGWGDFLRGSMALYQLCQEQGLAFDIHLDNHPLSEFIVSSEKETVDEKDVYNCMGVHFNDTDHYQRLVNHLHQGVHPVLYMGSNSFLLHEPVDLATRAFMQSKIRPTLEIKNYVRYTLYQLRLRPKQFCVLHIRTGDQYLLDKKPFPTHTAENIATFLTNNIHPRTRYLLLSDNNDLKRFLQQKFPNQFRSYCKSITHLGEDSAKTRDTIRNTLLDFYIMRLAKKIYGMTSYPHGSGFCQTCATVYNIPYQIWYVPSLLSSP